MSHSKTKIWIHAVFSSKDRQPLIQKKVRMILYPLIREQLTASGCYVDCINGVEDHIHILFLLNPQVAISDLMKHVKGSSSHEINRQNLIPEKFAWQTGYGAFSISESQIGRVRQYIANQEQHHRKMTFAEEYSQFMKNYGLIIDPDNGEINR
ncbi:IS200/IS605 family transposase [Larkinella terrae]|uniref:IS200/IS605 family transposase n=1 Tax=Larkinella terrae TaxID=2025311 RepID=A0A7K0EEF2_9BACT|nr:IS200/IS605 family transposase [Larkinella terrae]MRS59961.1 IS200/IS605 family transposase [Larkinella terrae]